MMTKNQLSGAAAAALWVCASIAVSLPAEAAPDCYLLNQPQDVSADFATVGNVFFAADSLAAFDAATARGRIKWNRYELTPRQAFNTNGLWPVPLQMLDFPTPAYDNDPELEFGIDFVDERTVRLRVYTSDVRRAADDQSLMLASEVPAGNPWKCTQTDGYIRYSSTCGSISICRHPWRIELRDADGRIICSTRAMADNDTTQVKTIPFSFVKRASDNSRSIAPVLSLMPGERIYGCGESFTGLNKAGQKLNLFVTDPQGPETDQMYKPVPFFMSDRGYGMFMHTSAPVTCDFGASYVGATKLFMADEQLDLFIFWGQPRQIIDAYTDITGKSPMPPLWSFGTWMSRITYFSQDEGYDVAARLRRNRIPADVIHFDTGWFGVDWQCDYKFAADRFADPARMIKDLRNDGFHISLWQLPYFTPKNSYFAELVDKRMYVRNAQGTLPYEDAVLDFSNELTVAWYQSRIADLLKMGVGAIKVDFGEAAPLLNGYYASGRGGLYEHNLYPLRYNKAVADITRQTTGENIIWARSAWAGSQRYPLHWGGDAANTNAAMLSTLRGGLSLGLCGFSFWSHDMGGFVQSTPRELYERWLPFGFLTSHTRAHGAPPTEPWFYDGDFCDVFRRNAEMKYRLMPYVYAQAKACTQTGLPMLRALLVEFPDDRGAWLVEDEYMFGADMLVAPLFENTTGRDVYLPGRSKWIDYQSGRVYQPGWNRVEAGSIRAVIMVRDGAVIPHAPLAQHTDKIDWQHLELKAYAADAVTVQGLVFRPGDDAISTVSATIVDGKPQWSDAPGRQ